MRTWRLWEDLTIPSKLAVLFSMGKSVAVRRA